MRVGEGGFAMSHNVTFATYLHAYGGGWNLRRLLYDLPFFVVGLVGGYPLFSLVLPFCVVCLIYQNRIIPEHITGNLRL